MKVGIIGLPQTGKKTLFQLLTGQPPAEHGDGRKPLIGTADIQDSRFDRLVSLYAPRKEVRARIDLALVPRLERETIARGDVFKDIVDTDAVCHVVRAFRDEAVYHVDGSVDAVRDVEMVNGELVLHDLLFIETRLERIEANLKKIKDEKQAREKDLLERMKHQLENDVPLRCMPLDAEDDLLIRSYPFITRKQMILAVNADEADLGSDRLIEQLSAVCKKDSMAAMLVSARVESEVAGLDSEEERAEFLQDLGVREPALARLSRLCIKALGLISFFTVGADEVRQWLVRNGATAPEAAGAIHSDLQRGFIRAETMKYRELAEHGDEAALKAAGKLYLKGKDYIVEDGDLLNIRFKV